MAKPTIVTRAGKGSALSHTEADANFTNLQNATISVTDGSTTTAIDLNGTVTFSGANGITVSESGGTITVDGSSLGLGSSAAGGDIDLNGNVLTDSTGDTTITTNATGNLLLAPATNQPVVLGNPSGWASAVIVINSDNSGYGPISGGLGSGLAFGVNNVDETAELITLTYGGGVAVSSGGNGFSVDGLSYPGSDGTANQVLTTDGSGNITFATVSYNNLSNTPTIPSAVSDLTNDTGFITSTLSGDLNVGANQLTYSGSSSFGISFETTGMVNLGYIQSYGEMIHVETTTTTGTWAPDAANGPIQYVPMTGNMTINGFSNVSGGQTISVLLDNTGGTYTLTLGANILQAGGDAETLSGGFDLLTITCVDDETPVYLAAIQAYS